MKLSLISHLILVTGILTVVLISGVISISHIAVSDENLQIAEEMATMIGPKAGHIIHLEEEGLLRFIADWSVWDDTYQFMQDKNENYIRSNLQNNTFFIAHVNYMLFFDNTGNLIYGQAYDYRNNSPLTLHQDLIPHLKEKNLIGTESDEQPRTGLITIAPYPILIVVHPIYRTDESGPSRGKMVIGRFLDEERVREISESAVFPFIILPPDEIPKMPLEGPSHSFAEVDDINKTIVVYSTFQDISGDPAYIIKTLVPYYTPYTSNLITLIIIIITSATGLYLLIIILYFRTFLIGQIHDLSRKLCGSVLTEEVSERIKNFAPAEISQLEDVVQQVIIERETQQGELEKSRKELAIAEERWRLALLEAEDAIAIGDDKRIIECNQAFLVLFGFNKQKPEECDLDLLVPAGSRGDFSRFVTLYRSVPKDSGIRFEWQPQNDETDLQTYDVRIRWISVSERMLRLVIARDITRIVSLRKKQEEALTQIRENLLHMATLNDEIRNPLTVITCLAEMKSEDVTERIQAEVKKIDHLIDMLDKGFIKSDKVRAYLKKAEEKERRMENQERS